MRHPLNDQPLSCDIDSTQSARDPNNKDIFQTLCYIMMPLLSYQMFQDITDKLDYCSFRTLVLLLTVLDASTNEFVTTIVFIYLTRLIE